MPCRCMSPAALRQRETQRRNSPRLRRTTLSLEQQYRECSAFGMSRPQASARTTTKAAANSTSLIACPSCRELGGSASSRRSVCASRPESPPTNRLRAALRSEAAASVSLMRSAAQLGLCVDGLVGEGAALRLPVYKTLLPQACEDRLHGVVREVCAECIRTSVAVAGAAASTAGPALRSRGCPLGAVRAFPRTSEYLRLAATLPIGLVGTDVLGRTDQALSALVVDDDTSVPSPTVRSC